MSACHFVVLDKVSVRYGNGEDSVQALDDASLKFEQGDFVCIVGPSGCGKTTLMQILAGFLKPSSGTVSVAGRPVTGPSSDRGVVFQQPALFPWMKVEANAGFGPMVRGIGRVQREKTVEQWLRLVGLWDFRTGFSALRWRIEPQRMPKSNGPPSPLVNSGEPQSGQKC